MASHTPAPLPSVIDLFAGCGGLSLGFQQAGFNVIAAFDHWKPAVATYNQNFTHPAYEIDLSDVPATVQALSEYASPNGFPALIGGPPCQDFSSAGPRIEGDRADLTVKFATIVAHYQPPFFVMENVPRSQHAAVYAHALTILKTVGYKVKNIVLDASLCGVPQKRKRLFTIGTQTPDLTDTIIASLQNSQDSQPTTVRDWFGDSLNTDTFYRHPRSYARRAIFSIDEPSPTIRGVNRPIPAGYPGHPGDAAPIHETRPLTTAERAQIQTFPVDFEFVGARTTVEQMIGNAVPVKLAHYVASAITQALLPALSA